MHLTNFQCVCIVICFIWFGLFLYCLKRLLQALFKADIFLDAFIMKLDMKNKKGEFKKYVRRKRKHYALWAAFSFFFFLMFFVMTLAVR